MSKSEKRILSETDEVTIARNEATRESAVREQKRILALLEKRRENLRREIDEAQKSSTMCLEARFRVLEVEAIIATIKTGQY